MKAVEEIATSFWDDDDRGGQPPLSDDAVARAGDLRGWHFPAICCTCCGRATAAACHLAMADA